MQKLAAQADTVSLKYKALQPAQVQNTSYDVRLIHLIDDVEKQLNLMRKIASISVSTSKLHVLNVHRKTVRQMFQASSIISQDPLVVKMIDSPKATKLAQHFFN